MLGDRGTIVFWSNPLQSYVVAGWLFVLLLFISWWVRHYLFAWGSRIIKNYKNKKGLYAVARTLLDIPYYIFVVVSVYIALRYLVLPDQLDIVIRAIFLVLLVFWLSRTLITFLSVLITRLIDSEDEKSADMTSNIVKLIVKIVVWITAILLVLINLWVEITPLLASLWVWWIAIAFALQNVLQDIFASISLFIERPFSIGDFVIIGDTMGVVKHIGFKSTRIQALEWQLIISPNKDIMNSNIQNYGAMEKRWKKQTIGVLYETPLDKLQKIPAIIEKEVDRIDGIAFSRAHLKELNAYSIDIEFAYFIESKELIFFLDKNQELLISIMKRFADEWIGIAYPTQLVYTKSESKV